jgi:hypothetical protein
LIKCETCLEQDSLFENAGLHIDVADRRQIASLFEIFIAFRMFRRTVKSFARQIKS